jgi:hypothetical protein
MPTAKTKPTIVHMEGRIMWKIGRSKEGNWIAICDALKLTLQAETTAELMEDIALALDALIKELLSTGDLNRFMREQGWKMISPLPKTKRLEDIYFDVPFSSTLMKRLTPYGSATSIH